MAASVQIHLGLAPLEALLQALPSAELVAELAQLLGDVGHSAEINLQKKDWALVETLAEAVTSLQTLEAGSPPTAFQEGVLASVETAFTETSVKRVPGRILMVMQAVFEEPLLGLVPFAAAAVVTLATPLQGWDSRRA